MQFFESPATNVDVAPEDVQGTENSTSNVQTTLSSVSNPSNRHAPPANIDWDGEGESVSEAYARILLAKGMGFPLWIPEPSSYPPEYEMDGIRIGDLGVITYDGRFDFLFNVCVPADHPINRLAPPAFEPMKFDPDRDVETIPDFHPRDCFITTKNMIREPDSEQYSGSIPGSGLINFNCLPTEGALLILPDGATRVDHRFRGAFLEYARRHTASWYAYVNGNLGLDGQNGSLYLVTGTDNALNWCLAGYSRCIRPSSLWLKYNRASGDTTVNTTSPQYSWQTSGSVEARSCQVGVPANQSVFIRGFRLSLGKHLFDRRYYGPVGSPAARTTKASNSILSMFPTWISRAWPFSGLLSGSMPFSDMADDPDVIVEMFPNLSEPHHPSMTINQYLLDQNPDADVAITHDDEWCAVVNENDAAMPEGPELLGRIFKQYKSQKEGGCVFLVPKKEPTGTGLGSATGN